MVDVLARGASGATRAGSSPVPGTRRSIMTCIERLEELLDERAKEVCISSFERAVSVDRDTVTVSIECSYKFNNYITFAFLCEIADLMGTRLIDITDEGYSPGCDTCDYGSSSHITIEIRGAQL